MGSTCEPVEHIKDFITGLLVPDTGEERVRQETEKMLVEVKGYKPEEIEVDRVFQVMVDGQATEGKAELVVSVSGRPIMTVKSAPGSLVTRHREALAASRLVFDQSVPLTVVANGEDADVLETATGKILGSGLDAVPSRDEALELAGRLSGSSLTAEKREKESRIYLAFGEFNCAAQCG